MNEFEKQLLAVFGEENLKCISYFTVNHHEEWASSNIGCRGFQYDPPNLNERPIRGFYRPVEKSKDRAPWWGVQNYIIWTGGETLSEALELLRRDTEYAVFYRQLLLLLQKSEPTPEKVRNIRETWQRLLPGVGNPKYKERTESLLARLPSEDA